ncbi:hypothetical protein PQQ87_35120 [Paraburkholderia nemoris]|uniref:hypothetical protein n=1 Tax=Paraburkholderia TaxID=1822464 RepID=UPI0038B84C1B
METSSITDNEFGRGLILTHIEKRLADLLAFVLTDSVTDIEVAARDVQISNAGFARLRRAMDRVVCAQSILETMRVERVDASGDETLIGMGMRVRDAEELLA